MAEVLYRLVKDNEHGEGLFDFVWGCVAALGYNYISIESHIFYVGME